MGDRANIIMQGETDTFPYPVYFYSHWKGRDIYTDLQKALEKSKSRWGDPAYLARIIFCQLVAGDALGLTGYGISTVMGDGGTELWVNTDDKLVKDDEKQWTYEEFIAEKFD